MNILLSNDDGIDARGLRAVAKRLISQPGMKLYVCAPDGQRSAAGHSISTGKMVLLNDVEFEGAEMAWSLSGTPADCVKFGVRKLRADYNTEIDVVISGINHGSNVGTDVLYSGTVSAAAEAVLCGVPGIALSVNRGNPSDDQLEKCADLAVNLIAEHFDELGKDTLLNINLPRCDVEEIKGLKVTSLGPREYNERFNIMESPRGQKYYWYSGEMVVYEGLSPDLDVIADQDGYATITPLKLDLTRRKQLDMLKNWNLSV